MPLRATRLPHDAEARIPLQRSRYALPEGSMVIYQEDLRFARPRFSRRLSEPDGRHLERYPRTAVGSAGDHQLSPQRAGPLPHPPGPPSGGHTRRIESLPVVGDFDPQFPGKVPATIQA